MNTISKHFFLALTGAVFLASCSRPVAYFQRTPTERFHSPQAIVTADPAKPTPVSEALTSTTVEQVVQAKQVMGQLEAYVRNDNKLASNHKLTKRLARINELLATSHAKATLSTNATSVKKMTLLERIVLKKIDKKIKNHVAPNKTNELSQNIKTASIVAAVGIVLFALFSGLISIIGILMFGVGVALILMEVLH